MIVHTYIASRSCKGMSRDTRLLLAFEIFQTLDEQLCTLDA